MKPESLLASSVGALGLSEEFCKGCREMGVSTLAEILALSPAQLQASKGFNYLWLAELSDYLSKKGLLSSLQALPGNNVT
jgi:hypothetical protein